MTGQIVFLRYTGWGEIRSPERNQRIHFSTGALVDIDVSNALGADVEFDTVGAKHGGIEAVKVRGVRSTRERRA